MKKALEVIKLLQEKQIIPISRAQMRIRIVCPGKEGKRLREKLSSFISNIESEDFSDQYELVCRK